MEENKEVKNQEVNKELSYEELKSMCAQLSEQARQLYGKLQEANLFNMFKRLEFLFKVVENFAVFDDDFSKACIKEIQDLLSLKEEQSEEQTEQTEETENE